MELDPYVENITDLAGIEILMQHRRDDDTIKAWDLIKSLFIEDPNPVVAKEILNKIKCEVNDDITPPEA